MHVGLLLQAGQNRGLPYYLACYSEVASGETILTGMPSKFIETE